MKTEAGICVYDRTRGEGDVTSAGLNHMYATYCFDVVMWVTLFEVDLALGLTLSSVVVPKPVNYVAVHSGHEVGDVRGGRQVLILEKVGVWEVQCVECNLLCAAL